MDDQAFASYRRMSRIVLAAQAAGLAAVLLFSLQTTSPVTLAAVASVGIMIAVAGFATGGLFGFVFGIPRSLQEPARPPATTGDAADPDADERAARAARVRYAGNTSLEQISDWLTKIIVGVGLTQLANLPGALGAFGELMGPPLGGFPGSTVLAPLELVFFGIGGFFLGYLWTRLYLMSLYVESDEAAQRKMERAAELRAIATDAARKANAKDAAQRAIEQGSTLPTARDVPSAGPAAAASETVRNVLWVDDQPEHNQGEIAALNGRGFSVTTKRSTDEGIAELKSNPDRYSLVISDMARPPDRRAGYTLLNEMKKNQIEIPLIFYVGSAAPELDVQARAAGAVGSTNSPIRLLDLVNRVVR